MTGVKGVTLVDTHLGCHMCHLFCGLYKHSTEVLLAHFTMERLRLGEVFQSLMLNTSQPFWDTKNQEVNPRRVSQVPTSSIKKRCAWGWRGPFLRSRVSEANTPLLNSRRLQGGPALLPVSLRRKSVFPPLMHALLTLLTTITLR